MNFHSSTSGFVTYLSTIKNTLWTHPQGWSCCSQGIFLTKSHIFCIETVSCFLTQNYYGACKENHIVKIVKLYFQNKMNTSVIFMRRIYIHDTYYCVQQYGILLLGSEGACSEHRFWKWGCVNQIHSKILRRNYKKI